MSEQKCFWIVLIFIITLSQNLFSEIVLQGLVTDTGSEPVQNALVELIDQTDTSRILTDVTNEQGQYFIRITDTGIEKVYSKNPENFNLLQNYPNPFNPSTVIEYELAKPAHVTIVIFNVLGQKMRTLVDEFQTNRNGRVVWDATDNLGNGVSAGVYVYSLAANGYRINKKMLLLDGHLCQSNSIQSHFSGTAGHTESFLKKQISNQYLLRVTGNNIETYEQQNLEIISNMVLNIKVTRTTVTDIDGNVYKTVKIGTQWWMAENLKVIHYQNGDIIPRVIDDSLWDNYLGAYCDYNNDITQTAIYGRLYNWYAVSDNRKISPPDYHVPSAAEWQILVDYLGGQSSGGKMKETGTLHWWNPNTGATNESGFSALPSGFRHPNGTFFYQGKYAHFWSLTEDSYPLNACDWHLGYDHSDIYSDCMSGKAFGYSIRCVKDNGIINTAPTASFTVYPVSGTTATIFSFDASGCSDNEEESSTLQIRWDWENDGIWDTNYSTIKIATHQYPADGTKIIQLEVRDTAGLIDNTTRQITVSKIMTGEMIYIQGGTFQMGSINGQWYVQPVHTVTLSSFWINKYEVTNAEYAQFLNSWGRTTDENDQIMIYEDAWGIRINGGQWEPQPGYENYPVVHVTWYGANQYAKWAGGRLPTEAEWEYAARGGGQSNGHVYSGSNNVDEIAWYSNNSDGHSHPVGGKLPNELGICDMSGNVNEYCQDWYSTYSSEAQVNPVGPASGDRRVVRGGSWYHSSEYSIIAFRVGTHEHTRNNSLGFRIVKLTQ
jgi:uncharacterized protein (TIGR02145 family)